MGAFFGALITGKVGGAEVKPDSFVDPGVFVVDSLDLLVDPAGGAADTA